MSAPSILFHRPGCWHSHIASSTKVLCQMFLEHGYDSYYFGLHPDIVSLARHPLRQSQLWKTEIPGEHDPVLVKAASLMPFRDIFPFNTPGGIGLGYQSSQPSLRSAFTNGKEPDVIWAARPGGSALKNLFPQARLIMQVVDYYPAFRGAGIRRIEKQDYARADHILLIGNALQSYLVDELHVPEHKTTVIGQGVHCSEFANSLPRPADFPETSGPVAIWVGVLSKSDPSLMLAAASQLQAMGGALLLIGSPCQTGQMLAEKFSCVHLMGPRTPDKVPAYLVHSNIGLMLYDRKRQDVYRGQNPLKLYEYAAAGLSILSTPHDEYEFLRPPVHICKFEHDVSTALQNAAVGDPDKKSVREFAQAHEWQAVFDRTREVIDRLATPAAARYDQHTDCSDN